MKLKLSYTGLGERVVLVNWFYIGDGHLCDRRILEKQQNMDHQHHHHQHLQTDTDKVTERGSDFVDQKFGFEESRVQAAVGRCVFSYTSFENICTAFYPVFR